MSEENDRDFGQAASTAARWRQLERQALDAAHGLVDPEAKQKMLFIAESYRLVAERIELRAELLETLQGRGGNSKIGGRDTDEAGGAK
jgi:hypothetical protein